MSAENPRESYDRCVAVIEARGWTLCGVRGTPWIDASKGPHVVTLQVAGGMVRLSTFLGDDIEDHETEHADNAARINWQCKAIGALLDRFDPPETQMKITSTHHHANNDGAIYTLADGRFVASHPDRDDVIVATADAAMASLAVLPTTTVEIGGVIMQVVDADEAIGWHQANDGPHYYDTKNACESATLSSLFRQDVRAVDPVVTIIGGDE